nr:hypothetical protein [Bacteroides helcogenes]
MTEDELRRCCNFLYQQLLDKDRMNEQILDEELIDIEHLCSLVHARAKFKKALDQGCEKARYFLLNSATYYTFIETCK